MGRETQQVHSRSSVAGAIGLAVVALSLAMLVSHRVGRLKGWQQGRIEERERFLSEAVARGYAKAYRNGRYEWRSPQWHGECVPLEIHAELYWVDGSGWTVVGVRKNNHPCAPESCRTKESEK